MLLTLAMAWADPVIGRVRTPEGKVRVVRVAGTETDQLWLRHKRTSTWLLTIPSSAVATLNPEGHLVVTGSARAEVQLAPLGLVSATYEGPAGALILARKGAVFGVVVGH